MSSTIHNGRLVATTTGSVTATINGKTITEAYGWSTP
jgi:hypothetical protein